MASEILSKYGGLVNLTHTELADLANTNGMSCLSVATASPVPPQVEINYEIVCQGASLVANSLIEFYLGRSDGAIADGDLDGADKDLGAAPTEVAELQFVHAQVIRAVNPSTYRGSFVVDNPGTSWQLVIVNNTGDAFDSTGHDVNCRTIAPEVQ